MKTNRTRKKPISKYYTSAEVRILLRTDVHTLTNLRNNGLIDYIKSGKKYLYFKDEITSMVYFGAPWFCMN